MTEADLRTWCADPNPLTTTFNIRTREQLLSAVRPLLVELDLLRNTAAGDLVRRCADLTAERDAAREVARRLGDRVAACSAVLSRAAERGKVVRCRECGACRGRGAFEIGGRCHWCEGSGLELPGGVPESALAVLADDGCPLVEGTT